MCIQRGVFRTARSTYVCSEIFHTVRFILLFIVLLTNVAIFVEKSLNLLYQLVAYETILPAFNPPLRPGDKQSRVCTDHDRRSQDRPLGKNPQNEVRPTTVDAQSYFSRARYRAERAAIRKERNTLEFGGGILGSVASYSDSWIETSGGDNSIGLAATLFLHHTFTKQRFTIETKFDAKFGYNRMNIEVAGDGGSTTSEATWYKNQDEFQISTNPAYIINKSWQVGSIIKFRSQFANGYVSRSQQTADDRKSTFMSPGYLDISGGFTYTCPLERFPIKINLADRPERRIRRKRQGPQQQMGRQTGLAGLRPFECEQNLEIRGRFLNPDRLRPDVRQKGIFRYRTTLFSFMGWMSNLNMKNRYTSVSAYEKKLSRPGMMHRNRR